MCTRLNGSDGNEVGDMSNFDGDTDDTTEALQPQPKKKAVNNIAMKKTVELDGQGQPFGSMKQVMADNIKKYEKRLGSDYRLGRLAVTFPKMSIQAHLHK